MHFFEAAAALRSASEAKLFLSALLTEKEKKEFNSRWLAMQAILDGKTQRTVRDELGVGIGTASRAAQTMKKKNHREIVQRILKREKSKKSRPER